MERAVSALSLLMFVPIETSADPRTIETSADPRTKMCVFSHSMQEIVLGAAMLWIRYA